jgi:hypothetical protein
LRSICGVKTAAKVVRGKQEGMAALAARGREPSAFLVFVKRPEGQVAMAGEEAMAGAEAKGAEVAREGRWCC